MKCPLCKHWNSCPRCTNYICEFCGEELELPPSELPEDDLDRYGNYNVGDENIQLTSRRYP